MARLSSRELALERRKALTTAGKKASAAAGGSANRVRTASDARPTRTNAAEAAAPVAVAPAAAAPTRSSGLGSSAPRPASSHSSQVKPLRQPSRELVLARREASRRANTSSRLGWRRGLTWEEWDDAGRGALEPRPEERVGAAAAGATATGAAASAALVRVGRASEAVRTRLALPPAAADAFLPAVVSALRRSSASSRLESLAMSARGCRREWKGEPFDKKLSPDEGQGSEPLGRGISVPRRPRSKHPGFGCRRRNRRCARGGRDKRDGKPRAR